MKPMTLLLAAAAALAGCSTNAPTPVPPVASAPASAPAAPTAPSAPSEAPFDARFIDAMIPHHQGAVTMAQEALTRAERAELKELAPRIISAQEAEIARMRAWREAWYPGLPPTGGLPMAGDHSGHGATGAEAGSYDVGFIDKMIPHHEGAVVMAERALAEAEHAELKELARLIIDAQRQEIAQMRAWREAWSP